MFYSDSSPKTQKYYKGEENGDLSYRTQDTDIAFHDEKPLRDELAFIAKNKVGGAPHVETISRQLTDGAAGPKSGDKTPFLTGIALSGGGIRSAIFSLGVLQKFSEAGILKQADYISTVSGGGFIGSALAWWRSGFAFKNNDERSIAGVKDELMPYGEADPSIKDISEPAPLQHLRRNGQYLVPGNGIYLLSGIAVLLRAILLNLIVWIPIVAAIFLAFNLVGTWSDHLLSIPEWRKTWPAEVTGIYVVLWIAVAFMLFSFLVHSIAYANATYHQLVENSASGVTSTGGIGWLERILVKLHALKGWKHVLAFVVSTVLILALTAILFVPGVTILSFINGEWTFIKPFVSIFIPTSWESQLGLLVWRLKAVSTSTLRQSNTLNYWLDL